MTTVWVFRDDEGRLTGFSADGHAGAKLVRGHDLVCSAVSALTQTAVNALETVAGVIPHTQVADGTLEMSLPQGMTSAQAHDSQTILRTIVQGLCDIQLSYPAHVRVVFKERR